MRRIADMYSGTVEAIPLQQGVTFRITVPEIAAAPPTAERASRRPETIRAVSVKLRVGASSLVDRLYNRRLLEGTRRVTD